MTTTKPLCEQHWSPETIQFIEQFTKTDIAHLKITKLAGDASPRSYYRVDRHGKRWVLLETDPFANEGEKFPYINVQKHLKKHRVHVPEIYEISSKLGLLFVEDFGDNSLERIATKLTPKQYSKYYFLAIDELFKIHFEASEKDPDCVAFGLAFDIEKLVWELEFTKQHLIEHHLKHRLAPSENSILTDFFKKISNFLSSQPRYFTHRDYHSRNLMLHDGKICVLDFQDARMGPCQYDLASLLKDSYVKLPSALCSELLKYYLHEKGRREGTKTDLNDFQKIFDWMSIQRNLKAMGTFAYLHLDKKKSGYLQYIQPTWDYVDANLKKFDEFKEPHKLLERIFKNL